MAFTEVVCPGCGETMHMGPARIERRIVFVLCCFHCPLITELGPTLPVRLLDFDSPTIQDAVEHGIDPTPLTRTAVPMAVREES